MGYFEQHLLPEEQNSIPYLPTTVLLLDFITKQYGQQIALSDENQEIRYDYLEQRIACRRHKLQELDLKARTNIGLFDGNSIDAVEWFLAVTTSGMVAVMIPPTMTEEALEKTAIHYELGAIIVGSPLEDRAKAVSIPMIAMSAMDQEGALPASVQKRARRYLFHRRHNGNTQRGGSESWSHYARRIEWNVSKRHCLWSNHGGGFALYPCFWHDIQHAVWTVCGSTHGCMQSNERLVQNNGTGKSDNDDRSSRHGGFDADRCEKAWNQCVGRKAEADYLRRSPRPAETL